MSAQAIAWVLNDADARNPTELAVLLAIADSAVTNGSVVTAYNGNVKFYAAIARCDERAAQKAILALLNRSVLTRYTATMWRLNIGAAQ